MPPRRKIRPVYFETTIPVVRLCACGVWFAAGVAEGQKAEVELTVLDLGQKLWAITRRIELFVITRTGLVGMDQSRIHDPRYSALMPQHYCHVKWPVPPPAPFVNSQATSIPPY